MTHAAPARPTRRFAVAVLLTAALSGCATTTANNPKDPFEKFNRAMFTFNDTVDQVALKPVATAYKAVLPSFVQRGIGNFFGNLNDVWSGTNNLMQGKGEAGLSDFSRFVVNSTFGVIGLIDVASEVGLRKHDEDFGQTLGYWGVPSGPYLMLPLMGPSTLRDTMALPIDGQGDLWRYKDPVNVRNIGTAVSLVDQRAALLDASNLMEEAALDRYEFIRDSYLQRRQNKVFDGEGSRKQAREAARVNQSDADKAEADKEAAEKAAAEKAAAAKPATDKPATDKPATDKPAAAKPEADKPVTAAVSSETPVKELTPLPVADASSGSQAEQ
jgi:phospholipid-binding lipoprotein MlaA